MARNVYGNRYAGFTAAWEPCDCSTPPSRPNSAPTRAFHVDRSDPDGEAWQRLLELIDRAAGDGRAVFAPGREMPAHLWRQIVTLPASISRLTEVKDLILYGSNLIAVPPGIGAMASLENFQPYTSRRLHWFPYDITRCSELRDSTVSTRQR
jgi:hypothetical protein